MSKLIECAYEEIQEDYKGANLEGVIMFGSTDSGDLFFRVDGFNEDVLDAINELGYANIFHEACQDIMGILDEVEEVM